MHIHYNTNQTTLPLEISSFLPQDHLVFTIEKVVNTLEDSYTHPDGWSYRFHHIKHQKTQTDFQQEIKVYYADESEATPQKGLYMNERYQNLKTKECQALLSPQGRQISAQGKIDVEPVFGQIKACLGYKRCNLRGKRQVRIDMGLVLMANNLIKYNKRKTQN